MWAFPTHVFLLLQAGVFVSWPGLRRVLVAEFMGLVILREACCSLLSQGLSYVALPVCGSAVGEQWQLCVPPSLEFPRLRKVGLRPQTSLSHHTPIALSVFKSHCLSFPVCKTEIRQCYPSWLVKLEGLQSQATGHCHCPNRHWTCVKTRVLWVDVIWVGSVLECVFRDWWIMVHRDR